MPDAAVAPKLWRIIRTGPFPGPRNMAIDEALARCHRPGTAVLRLYQWDVPTVSLGRNQPGRDRYDLARADELGIAFVRRPTGGRAVLHDRELTYAVVMDASALGGPRRIYARVQAALTTSLVGCGLSDAEQKADGAGPAPRPSLRPCFGAALPGEVTVGGRKIVGSAQARISRSILQHGSILIQNDQTALAQLLQRDWAEPGDSDDSVPGPAPTLFARGLAIAPEELAGTVLRTFEEAMPGRFEASGLTSEELEEADRLVLRYEDPDWTWRR